MEILKAPSLSKYQTLNNLNLYLNAFREQTLR
jgi:hypothetical protein